MSIFLGLMKGLRRKRTEAQETLYEIYLRNRGQDLHKWHHYFEVYEQFLAPYRGQRFTLLEIGLWRGGSLRMWRKYFGPSATIVGMDIDPACSAHERDGFRIFIGDQANAGFLAKVKDEVGRFDIVIDDGGHTMSQQIASFEALYPVTKRLYIVEDTHTSYWPKFRDMGSVSFLDYAREKVDALHEWHHSPESFFYHGTKPDERRDALPVSEFCRSTRAIHFYDSLVVVEKGDNPPRWHEVK
jgi:hypothetical protein